MSRLCKVAIASQLSSECPPQYIAENPKLFKKNYSSADAVKHSATLMPTLSGLQMRILTDGV